MTDDRERWALILGASSGMGEATALALAARGYKIVGIHLDFRAALAHVEEVKAGIAAAGSEALYINMNAADDEKRAAAISAIQERFEESRRAGRHPYLRVVMHSLAFGSLVPFIADDPKDAVDRKKMEMTQDVMGNSLVYWVQDLYHAGFLERGSKIYAMTSEGTDRVVPSYGVVSGAKAALESHIRQLAMEFARRDTGIAVNSIRAGVTDTPALRKIPEAARMIEVTMARNPHGRMTTPQDVAEAIVSLSETDSDWISGNIIGVDGGEFVTGLSESSAIERRSRRSRHRGLGQYGSRCDGRSAAGARRDRHRCQVLAPPRRKGRQPGRRRRAARCGRRRSSGPSARTRSGRRRGQRSRPRGSTSPPSEPCRARPASP